MKIAHINSVYGIGSTGKIVEEIHAHLLLNGYESLVFCGRNHPVFNVCLNQETVIDTYNVFSLSAHVLKGVLFDKHGLYSDKETILIINKLREYKPSIVHLHNLHGFYLNYDLLFEYLNKTNVKVIWTLHDAWSYTGFCSHYSYNQCVQWKSGCKECKFRNVYPYRLLSNSKNNYELKKSLYKNNKFVIVTPSKWLSDELSDSFLKDSQKEVISNGVNLDHFYEDIDTDAIDKKYGLNDKKVLISVSNGWTIQKGYKELLKLAKALSDEERLVIIGLNQKQMNEVKKFTNVIGIERTTDISELRKWYSKASAMINLSLDDTYPTVNIEAIACGTPLITYDEGGASELGKRFGLTIKRGELSKIPGMLGQLKKVVIDRNEFSKDVMIAKYMQLYEKKGGK